MNQNRIGMARIDLALIHYPVYDKTRRVVSTAIVTLDIHDLCRLSTTYGMGNVYIVNPLEEQIELAERLVEHWVSGYGSDYNPSRREALKRARLVRTFEEVLSDSIASAFIISTTARRRNNQTSFKDVAEALSNVQRAILVFGTGYGLTEEFLDKSSLVLEPIETDSGFNHLSVRCAAAIIVDRLYRYIRSR